MDIFRSLIMELPSGAFGGAVSYQGTWNASTNSPALASGVGLKGYYYVVSVAGSTNLDGITDWQVGDWAIFNGSTWEKVDTTDKVSSVFGRTGAVVGVSTDYSSVGITNTAIGASNPSTGAFTTIEGTSLTGPTSTNLTLQGGSTGASLVLGQGTNGNLAATVPNAGTGVFSFSKAVSAAVGPVVNLINAFGGTNSAAEIRFSSGSTAIASIRGISVSGEANGLGLTFRTSSTNGGTDSEYMRLTQAGNLLIGGTTDISGSGGLKVFGTTAASSTTTGALQVAGGVGVAGKLYTGGDINATSGTASTNRLTGALVVTGGVGVTGDLNLQGSVSVTSATSMSFGVATAGTTITLDSKAADPATAGATTKDSPTLNLRGSYWGGASATTADVAILNRVSSTTVHGLSFKTGNTERLYIENTAGNASFSSTTASTSTTTGALIVSGGVGVAGRVTAGSFSAPGSGSNSEMFGAGATLGTGINNTAIGASATTASGNLAGSLAVGKSASAIGGDDVAVGANSSAAPGRSVAVGVSASTTTSNYGIAIGWFAVSTGGIRIGGSGTAAGGSIAIGAFGLTSAFGEIRLSNGNSDSECYFGAGSAAAVGYYSRINGTQPSSAGTGGILYLAGGKGGDAASTGGAVTIQTANAGAGTTLVNSWSVAAGGRISHTPSNFSLSSWTTSGALTNLAAATVTNSSTAASGTAASAVFHSFATPTLAATNASVTTTDAATVYIAGAPTAGTNQTLTNAWGLWNAGKSKLAGSVSVTDASASTSTTTGALIVSGGVGVAGNIFLGGKLNMPTATPASASATGTTGDIAWDSSYIYVCTATNTWKRVAIATW